MTKMATLTLFSLERAEEVIDNFVSVGLSCNYYRKNNYYIVNIYK
jgi:hypothetical protein